LGTFEKNDVYEHFLIFSEKPVFDLNNRLFSLRKPGLQTPDWILVGSDPLPLIFPTYTHAWALGRGVC